MAGCCSFVNGKNMRKGILGRIDGAVFVVEGEEEEEYDDDGLKKDDWLDEKKKRKKKED